MLARQGLYHLRNSASLKLIVLASLKSSREFSVTVTPPAWQANIGEEIHFCHSPYLGNLEPRTILTRGILVETELLWEHVKARNNKSGNLGILCHSF
jgi:hypothetical protein